MIQTPAQHDYAKDRVLSLKSRGYTAELLSAGEARAIEPGLNPKLLGAMYFPLRGQADPPRATRAFADAARERGAEILTGTEVVAIDQHADGEYRLTCEERTLRGPQPGRCSRSMVRPGGRNAEDSHSCNPRAWADVGDGAPCRRGCFIPCPAWSPTPIGARIPAGTVDLPPELTHVDGRRTTRHLYGRQTRDGEIVFGGDRQAIGYDRSVDAGGIENNFAHTAEVLPLLHELAITRTWSGLMPFSLDGRPIIGKIPQLENLYIATGLASSGFGRGPMAGKLIADYIHTGHRPHVLSESDPARCVTLIG